MTRSGIGASFNVDHSTLVAGDTAACDAWITRRLDAAEWHCRARGSRLTRRRREILALLLQQRGCIKAYELLKLVQRTDAHATPPTVYRPLRFLVAQGLANRIEALNAFVACDFDDGGTRHDLMLVCPRCSTIVEIADTAVGDLLHERLRTNGFARPASAVEINALCTDCAAVQFEPNSRKTGADRDA